jgi:glycosyltransferase involved in cell wall biosynthesis
MSKSGQHLISVIIPCYNYAKYLSEAVESVLAQTYQDFEIIIVNDGSSDNTQEVAEQLVQQHSQHNILLINQDNCGQPAISRNVGISRASGEYILPLDADDRIAPTMLEECLEILERDHSVAIIYCDRQDFGGVQELAQALEYDPQRLPRANFMSYCAMYRREVWQAIGGYRTNLRGIEDWDFWVAARALGYHGRRIPKPLFYYRRHDTGVFQEVLADYDRKAARLTLNNRELYSPEELKKAQMQLGISQGQPVANPLVSIVVPTVNRPQMLFRALQSIFNQSFQDFEVVVVNDAGTEAESVVRKFCYRDNVTYHRHPANRGLAAARNAGIRLARGKYISYLDDDDFLYPNHLRTLVEAIAKGEYRLVYSDAMKARQERRGEEYVTVAHEPYPSTDFDFENLLLRNQAPVLCIMHEKTCIDEVGGFDESLRSHEDWDLWIRMGARFPFGHVRQLTCEVSWRADGSTMTSSRQLDYFKDRRTVFEKNAAFFTNKPELLKQQREELKSAKRAIVESKKVKSQ